MTCGRMRFTCFKCACEDVGLVGGSHFWQGCSAGGHTPHPCRNLDDDDELHFGVTQEVGRRVELFGL